MAEFEGEADAVRRRNVRIGVLAGAALLAVLAGAGAANGILQRHERRVETETTAAADGRTVPIQVDATRKVGDAPRLAGQIPTMNWGEVAANTSTAPPAVDPSYKAYMEQQKRDAAAIAADQKSFEARLRAWAEPFLPALGLGPSAPSASQRAPARPPPQLARNDLPADRRPDRVIGRDVAPHDDMRIDGEDRYGEPPRRRIVVSDGPADGYDYYARFSRYRRSDDRYDDRLNDRGRDEEEDNPPPWVARRPPPPPPPRDDDGW